MFLLILYLLDILHHPLFTILYVHLFQSMCAYEHYYSANDPND